MQEKSFEALRKRFIMEPSLVVPDLDKKVKIEVNVSDYTTEEVLSMECSIRKWRLVAYLSKSLNKTEKNYEIRNKEILVVVRGLENWRYLLKGTKFKFEAWIDYMNLKYLMKTQKLN